MERIANFFLTKKKESTTKGAFKQKVNILKGTLPLVATLVVIQIPATPPMVKLLGVIKLYTEKETIKEERKTRRRERTQERIAPFLVPASGLIFSLVIFGGNDSIASISFGLGLT